jgi:hypothetical protein
MAAVESNMGAVNAVVGALVQALPQLRSGRSPSITSRLPVSMWLSSHNQGIEE